MKGERSETLFSHLNQNEKIVDLMSPCSNIDPVLLSLLLSLLLCLITTACLTT